MNTVLLHQIKNGTAHRKSRDASRDFVISYPETLADVVFFAFDVNDKDSHKACWILELVAYERLEWFVPHLDFISASISKLTDESSIRPLAKICQLLAEAHYKKSTTTITLSATQLENITEACFDWLINNTKVAAKAYAMRTLLILGKHSEWIYPELRIILEKDYQQHSAGYKAAARDVLKQIAR